MASTARLYELSSLKSSDSYFAKADLDIPVSLDNSSNDNPFSILKSFNRSCIVSVTCIVSHPHYPNKNTIAYHAFHKRGIFDFLRFFPSFRTYGKRPIFVLK